jgi:hypothetical protein
VEDYDMPAGHRITTVTAFAALAAIITLLGSAACSSDATLDSGGAVPNSEIDQTVASDAGESFAADVSQFQDNESFEENLSAGASTFMAGRSGAGFGADSRTTAARTR